LQIFGLTVKSLMQNGTIGFVKINPKKECGEGNIVEPRAIARIKSCLSFLKKLYKNSINTSKIESEVAIQVIYSREN
jgi:hypothetical protein